MSIIDNIINIKDRIHRTCERVGRRPEDIILVAVTKTVPVADIQLAIKHGIQHIGENRVQEASDKFNRLGQCATWHLIGHLQTNKVKKALAIFDLIHSVDSLHLAQELSRLAQHRSRPLDCLIEVHTSHEATKYGVAPEETLHLIKEMAKLPAIRVQGLMTIGPFVPDLEQVRPSFRLLRELKDFIQQQGVDGVEMKYLSMGMTNDFEIAIEEGANMLRIGRAIFGERN
ncbi:MAG: YggS family pyridoxal phosphate-dependent enzyme [candidate division KSB1 bacterium]|nr:YggS family pyridoxal phosphate-dependent enzyme [candidate division KSB1 bacterium]MDZ7340268.1 YggS family pyridoxal phosphate-dependent enzyme [candidate division KSB1 bacterium]